MERLSGSGRIRPLGALGSAPLQSHIREVTQLDDPSRDVRGNGELVIENGALIHLISLCQWR